MFGDFPSWDVGTALVWALDRKKLTCPPTTDGHIAVLQVMIESFQQTNPFTAALRHRTVNPQCVDFPSHRSRLVILDNVKFNLVAFRARPLRSLYSRDALFTEEVLVAAGVDGISHQLRAERAEDVFRDMAVEG